MKHLLQILFWIGMQASVYSQIQIFDFPQNLHFYVREHNEPTFPVPIKIVSNDSLLLSITCASAGGQIINRDTLYSKSNGLDTVFALKADTVLYHFTLYNRNNTNIILAKADSVVCGDVLLANGQSNMLAETFPMGSMNGIKSTWIRSFGNATFHSNYIYDTSFYVAQSNTIHDKGSVGCLMYYLAEELVRSEGIPIMVLNGAEGGTRISQHQKSSSIYQRLLYRATKSGVKNRIKAIIWYQGENDVDSGHVDYNKHFESLFYDWQDDYGHTPIFIVQIRHGCLGTQPFVYHRYLRSIQNDLSTILPDTYTLPSLGYYDYDGCHFYNSGYQQLAVTLHKTIHPVLYGEKLASILPPVVKKMELVAPYTITLEFTTPLMLKDTLLANGQTIYAKDVFFGDSDFSTPIVDSYHIDNQYLTLRFKDYIGIPDTLWYTPERSYHSDHNSIFEGPYLYSTTGIPANSFCLNLKKEIIQIQPSITKLSQNDTSCTIISNSNGKLMYNTGKVIEQLTIFENTPKMVLFRPTSEIHSFYMFNYIGKKSNVIYILTPVLMDDTENKTYREILRDKRIYDINGNRVHERDDVPHGLYFRFNKQAIVK